MKTNITLICVLSNYGKTVSKMLSDKLDMFFADMEEMFEYELVDSQHILEALGNTEGSKYIKDSEIKVIKNVSQFENTFINIDPKILFADSNYDTLAKSSYVVYAQISPKFFEIRSRQSCDIIPNHIGAIGFSERDKEYVNKSDIVVNCSNLKESRAVKKILFEINKFFKKQSQTNN